MDMKTRKHRESVNSGFKPVSIFLHPGDEEMLDDFFSRHRNLKKGAFYRDAIMDAMLRYDRAAGEREAIRAGRTQIDPSLVKGA